MSAEFDLALDKALSLLEAGLPLEECLARYPQYAAELAPLLRTAILSSRALGPIEPFSAAALAAGRQRLLQAAQRPAGARQAARGKRSVRRSFLSGLRPALRPLATLLAAIVLLGLVGGGMVAAADSLPGDALYPIKRASEQIRLSLTLDAAARQQLQQEMARERRHEVQAVVTMGREVAVQFQGIVEAVDATEWVISGLQVVVSPDTRIEGQPTVGDLVLVQADVRSDGLVQARELRVIAESVAPTPTATATSISTRSPHPTEPPQETSTPTQSPTPTPTPSSTPIPTSTPTPTPSSTPIPTSTSTATPTKPPSPQLSRTPTPPPVPQPTQPPENTEEPAETKEATREPQDTPEPTEELENTPEPTQRPEETAEPTEEPEDTPEPTEESGWRSIPAGRFLVMYPRRAAGDSWPHSPHPWG